MKDYYKILNVNRTAGINEIKKAYRKLALQWHPDRNKSIDAQDKFVLINEAYEILRDVLKRNTYNNLYDEFIARQNSQFIQKESETDYSKYNEWRGEARKEATRKAEMSYSEFSKVVGKVYQGASNGCGIIFGIAMWIAWGPAGLISLGQGIADMFRDFPEYGFKVRYIFLILFFLFCAVVTILGIVIFFINIRKLSD